jgi:putative salt-induced outer membrane protein YdiY
MGNSAPHRRRAPRATAVALLLCLTFMSAGAREKADVITMRNGDRLTGQILVMQYGKLSLKTDYLGTATIEWLDIARAESPQQFVVEDLRGRHFAGSLEPSATARQITVMHGDGASTTLGLDEIERVYAGEQSFLNRLEGSFAVGFDYAKATDISTITGSFDSTYRAPEFRWNITADINTTEDPERGTIDRHTVAFSYQWLRKQQRFVYGLTLLERNEETGIDARLMLGTGLGKYLKQTSKSEFSATLGAALTREWATGSAEAQESIEGILGANWRIFKFNSPTISMNSAVLLFPSLTDSGRYRSNVNVTLRREVIKDFYLDLSFYHSYDSDPPDEDAASSDHGITTSLGYSFY